MCLWRAECQALTWEAEGGLWAGHWMGEEEKRGPCPEGAIGMTGQTGREREREKAVGVVQRSAGRPKAQDAGKASWKRKQCFRASQRKGLRCAEQK